MSDGFREPFYLIANLAPSGAPSPTRTRSATPPAEILPGAPNPFRAATDHHFQLAAAGPYRLEVCDAAGRRVAGFEGLGRAVVNAAPWNGRDGDGRPVVAGVYCYRLVAGGRPPTAKILRLP